MTRKRVWQPKRGAAFLARIGFAAGAATSIEPNSSLPSRALEGGSRVCWDAWVMAEAGLPGG